MSENTYRAIGLVVFLAMPFFMIYGAGSHSGAWFFGSIAVGCIIVAICVALAERAAIRALAQPAVGRDGTTTSEQVGES